MIIKARHHWFFYPFFKLYSRFLPKFDFKSVQVHGEARDQGLPVFMIGNHFSWWDGFLALFINMEKFGKKFHIMMLEEQLRSRMFLNKAGAYSINRNSRTMVESLNYTHKLLSDPANMVVMYPQGAIHSMHDHPYAFEKGWYRVIDRLEQPVQFIMYFALVDYFSNRKPSLHIYLYDYDYTGKGAADAESAFNNYFEEALKIHRSWS